MSPSEGKTLFLRNVPTELIREAKAAAARRGKTLTTIVAEALARSLAVEGETADRTDDLHRDMAWYRDHRSSLLRRYAGEYVAIVDAAVVDHGRDFGVLASRVFARFGNRNVYMPRVEIGERTVRDPITEAIKAVSARFEYDASLDPPASVVPVGISGPIGDETAMLPMLVDTGADCTLVPASIVLRLGLPQVDVIGLTGVGGAKQRATVHAATVELGGLRWLARVVAFDDEAILGRDVLNQAVLLLDGPSLAISVQGRSRTRRPRRST